MSVVCVHFSDCSLLGEIFSCEIISLFNKVVENKVTSCRVWIPTASNKLFSFPQKSEIKLTAIGDYILNIHCTLLLTEAVSVYLKGIMHHSKPIIQ